MGDSVPKHTGPISLTDTHLEPSVLRTRPTTTRENRQRWKGLVPRDTQAACRCNCLASNSTPFFQMVNVMAAIFRAWVGRAIVGRIPFSTRATEKSQSGPDPVLADMAAPLNRFSDRDYGCDSDRARLCA